MIELVSNPSLWFHAAIVTAALATGVWRRGIDAAAAMNRFYGVVIVVMGIGHIVAVSLRLVLGTLSPTTSRFAIPLGFLLACPAFWLAVRPANGRMTLVLNGWLAGALIVLGASAPLAIHAVLNLVYAFRRRRALVVAAVVVYVAMFVAAFFVPAS
jgi:hypothetical protein